MIEQALETAGLMLGTDKSRGYCLEMICTDFLAGASLESGNSEILLQSVLGVFKLLPEQERIAFLEQVSEMASRETSLPRSRGSSLLLMVTRSSVIGCQSGTTGDVRIVIDAQSWGPPQSPAEPARGRPRRKPDHDVQFLSC